MASSHRRKKQNRAKAAAKHAEARRRRAATARIRSVQARLSRIYDPGTSAAELAILLAEHYQGVPVAGWLAAALLREGSSLGRLQDAAKVMLSGQDAPSLTTLTFAAAVAGAARNAGEERRLIGQALAAVEAGDPDVWLEVVDFISTSGHAAEAVELLELRLKEAPDDDFAVDLYGAAIERAYATACADETAARERAAVDRFTDRAGLVALMDAVSAFLDGTELGEAVRARVTEELSVTDDLDWSPEDGVALASWQRRSPCSPWTPARARARRRAISGICWRMMIRAPRCGRSRPTCRHRRRWRLGPWPGTSTSTTACGGSMIGSRGRACGASISSPAPVSAEMVSLTGKVAGAMITGIAADVHRYRATPPAIANTDGDPMCLISATIAVEEGTSGKLAARPDFDRDSDEPDRVTWWGALIPDGQREAMMADAMAQLRAQGHQDVEAPDGPQRWVRGVLRLRGREITVEVNSQQRLTRLLDILRKIGGNPVVTSEKRIDPAMDYAWPVGQRASQGGTAAAAEGWEKFWLDEKVPALFGRTPRQAARGRERPYLEAMLRQFEYEADLLAVDGKTGVDTAWLREQLDMPNDLAD